MFKVYYNNIEVANKNLFKSQVLLEPNFCIKTNKDKIHTLILFDPDVVQPDWLHWLVINIKGNEKEILVNYFIPNPPSGIHRYIFLLCEQQSMLSINKIEKRYLFDIREFLKENKLSIVDSTFFTINKNINLNIEKTEESKMEIKESNKYTSIKK